MRVITQTEGRRLNLLISAIDGFLMIRQFSIALAALPMNDPVAKDPSLDEVCEFYQEHYDTLGFWLTDPSKRIVLKRSDGQRICRFCGRGRPQVTFKTDAHAIPESIGNKSLFSDYECDSCNRKFGSSFEDDFGKWSKPLRTVSRIEGKRRRNKANGVPTLKDISKDDGWRVEYKDRFLHIRATGVLGHDVCLPEKRLTLNIPREPYRPMGVFKTFVKMALTIMPADELPNFRAALSWLQQPAGRPRVALSLSCSLLLAWHTRIPGPLPNDRTALFLLRRKNLCMNVPHMTLITLYGNEMMQVFVPSSLDAHLVGKRIDIPAFPTAYDFNDDWPYGDAVRAKLDLSDDRQRTDEATEISMVFDEIKEEEHEAEPDEG